MNQTLKTKLLETFNTFAIAFKAVIENAFKEVAEQQNESVEESAEIIQTRKRIREVEKEASKDQEEDSFEEEDASFINNNSDVSEFSSSIIDAEVVENNLKKMKNPQKRQVKKTKLLNVDNKALDYDNPNNKCEISEYCGDHEYTREDIVEMKTFRANLENFGLDYAIRNSTGWWNSHFGSPLQVILNSMGRQGKNNDKAKAIIDELITRCRAGSVPPSVEESKFEFGNCCLCNERRNCSFTLIIGRQTRPLGNKCVELARAIIEFYETLNNSDAKTDKQLFLDLLQLMDNINQAHENKSTR